MGRQAKITRPVGARTPQAETPETHNGLRYTCQALVFSALWLAAGASEASAYAGVDLDRTLGDLGAWAPLLIVGLRFAAALAGVVPSSPLLLAAGATEGVVLGSLYVLLGAQLGAVAGFLAGRRIGSDFMARRGWMDRLAQSRLGGWLFTGGSSQGRLMAAVFYCRLVPGLNFDALSYVAGVTPLTFGRFFAATFAGLLPYTVVVVALGQQLIAFGPMEFTAVLLALIAASALPALRHMGHRPAGDG